MRVDRRDAGVVVDDIKFPVTMLPVYRQNRKGIDPTQRVHTRADIGSRKNVTAVRHDCCLWKNAQYYNVVYNVVKRLKSKFIKQSDVN